MSGKRSLLAILLLSCCAVFVVTLGVPVAQGAIQDIYRAMDTYPGNPYYSPLAGGPFWPSGWLPVPRDGQGNPSLTLELQADQVLWLALENLQRPMTKTVWLNFGGLPVYVEEARAGYEDGHTVPWNLVYQWGVGSLKEYIGTISPQPGWEWVKLRNDSASVVTFNLLKYESECIPEPATLALLALAGLALLQRRF